MLLSGGHGTCHLRDFLTYTVEECDYIHELKNQRRVGNMLPA